MRFHFFPVLDTERSTFSYLYSQEGDGLNYQPLLVEFDTEKSQETYKRWYSYNTSQKDP